MLNRTDISRTPARRNMAHKQKRDLWTVTPFQGSLCEQGRFADVYFAPPSNQRPISARSSSVMLVMFPNGIAFCTTTCW